jgi:hypothetical protein
MLIIREMPSKQSRFFYRSFFLRPHEGNHGGSTLITRAKRPTTSLLLGRSFDSLDSPIWVLTSVVTITIRPRVEASFRAVTMQNDATRQQRAVADAPVVAKFTLNLLAILVAVQNGPLGRITADNVPAMVTDVRHLRRNVMRAVDEAINRKENRTNMSILYLSIFLLFFCCARSRFAQ